MDDIDPIGSIADRDILDDDIDPEDIERSPSRLPHILVDVLP